MDMVRVMFLCWGAAARCHTLSRMTSGPLTPPIVLYFNLGFIELMRGSSTSAEGAMTAGRGYSGNEVGGRCCTAAIAVVEVLYEPAASSFVVDSLVDVQIEGVTEVIARELCVDQLLHPSVPASFEELGDAPHISIVIQPIGITLAPAPGPLLGKAPSAGFKY
jgi:hypothetical protein